VSNASAITSLRQLRDNVSRMPEAIPAIARRSAEAIEKQIAENIARGVGPDGKPWPPTEDGHKPLAGAANAVTSSAVGATVVVRVSGVEARHHAGKVNGGVARPIIPRGKLPPGMLDEVSTIATDEMRRRARGGR
jgi:hypothetical protein